MVYAATHRPAGSLARRIEKITRRTRVIRRPISAMNELRPQMSLGADNSREGGFFLPEPYALQFDNIALKLQFFNSTLTASIYFQGIPGSLTASSDC